jgi:hypothetical protein
MIVGNAAHILAVTTSSDRALNGCGYCMSSACGGSCTVNSPTTDRNYTPNPATPNWDYRVQYEIWIAAEAFGAAGFGSANISYVHASPAKTQQETMTVTPMPCPPNWDVPYKPNPPPTPAPGTGGAGGTPPGGMGGMGTGGMGGTGTGGMGGTSGRPDGGTCPVDYQTYLTSEGAATCVPIPRPGGDGGQTCPIDWTLYLTSEGAATCVPTPVNGVCPAGYKLDVRSEGRYCI